ncbi:MAG: Na+/H+ antiporter subunit E [Xanthomonadaceae bacterium]|jgi:multicomponent K+:H+ antiporter subunit E|nr:Na+/H+ antiporter subunit E [Xanthomonadaceae bacterium]
MIGRWIPSWPLSLTIFCFWVLMNSESSLDVVIMGLILGAIIPLFAARLDTEFARVGSLRQLPRMLCALAWDIILSNITVARQVLGRESRLTPGFIWYPLSIGNIHGIATLASIITMTPGTVTATISDDRRYLLIHVFNLKDAGAVIEHIKRHYEVPLMEIFP